MRLENLYKNFATSSIEEQMLFIRDYRLRRSIDLDKPSTYKSKSVKTSKIDVSGLTEEEKKIMKLLGLKQKDIVALRAAASKEVGVEDDDDAQVELFSDSTFSEDEE
jgi:hypothetical protein